MKKFKKNSQIIGTGLLFLNLISCSNLTGIKNNITIKTYISEEDGYYVLVENTDNQWKIKKIGTKNRIGRESLSEEILYVAADLKFIAPSFNLNEVEKKASYICQTSKTYQNYHPCASSKLSVIEKIATDQQSFIDGFTLDILKWGTAPGYRSFDKNKPLTYINREYSVTVNKEAIAPILAQTNLIEIIKNNRTLLNSKNFITPEEFNTIPNVIVDTTVNNIAPEIKIGEFDKDDNSSITHFTVIASNKGGGVGDINIYLDDTRLNPKIITSKKDDEGSVIKEYELDLPYGQNTIKAIAYDHSNVNKSSPASYQLTKDYYSQPTLHVLSIGIKKYSGFKPLGLTENDAKSIGETLIEQNNELYKNVNVSYLTDRVTKNDIVNKLKEIKRRLKPYDSFIFYVASHGYYDEQTKKYFIIPSDYKKEEFNTRNFNDAISQDELNKLLMDLNTANKLIILDTCHSGQLSVSFEDIEIEQKNIAKDLGISIITAAKKEELSWENKTELNAGVFTHYFTEALKNKGEFKDKVDKNHDSIIDSFELYNMVKKYSAKFTKENSKIQHASYFQSGRAFEIALLDKSKKPKKLQPKNFSPEEIQQLHQYSDDNNTEAIQKIYEQKDEKTASLKNALKAEDQFTKKFITKKQIDRIPFTFGEKYIFLGLNDTMKSDSPQLYYDNKVNRYLLYADFYSPDFITHSNTLLDTGYIEKVDIGWHDVFYRVTMHLKPGMYDESTMSYELIKANEGYFFNIK